MSLRFLLDTNLVSEPLRPEPDPAVVESLRHFEPFEGLEVADWRSGW